MASARVFLVTVLLILALVLVKCGTRINSNSNVATATAPGLLHVTNGSTIGFYKLTGAYGFTTSIKSIFQLGANYAGGPFAQNTTNGTFYFGAGVCSSCNNVFYLNGLSGGYKYTTEPQSVISLEANGTSAGVAANSLANLIYVADPVNEVVTYLSGISPTYGLSSEINSIFATPLPDLAPQYVAYESSLNIVTITENAQGSAFFMNGTNGNAIDSTAGTTLPLTSGSTSCIDAADVSYVVSNSTSHMDYILCGNTVIFVKLSPTPGYLTASLPTSTFNLTGMTIATAEVYDSVDNAVVVTGQSIVTSLNGLTGATNISVDLSTYGCGSGISTGGITYDAGASEVMVSDTANSAIYVLKASTLALSTGSCASSVFSTATDVPSPTNLGYY